VLRQRGFRVDKARRFRDELDGVLPVLREGVLADLAQYRRDRPPG
jgi:hypothetical protein